MLIYSKSKNIITVLLVTFLLYSCSQKKEPAIVTPKDYKVLILHPQQTTTFNDFPATVQGEDIIEIRPMVDGYLEAIYVKEGATVKKGQLLFKIKNPQFEQAVTTADASIRIAIADVSTARMNVEKVRPLVANDIISKYELESAEYALRSKEAALAQAKAALAIAKTNLGYTILRSPQQGVISSIPCKIGALVSNTTSEPLTILSNIDSVSAYFSIDEKRLLSFLNNAPGKSVDEKLSRLPAVSLLLADGSLYSFKGKLETASGLITTQTGSASFKATFPNPMGTIRSGASAIVRVPGSSDNALLVPQSCSFEIQDKQFVYVLRDNRVFSTAITSKPTNNGQLLIIQKGLIAGDQVIINGSNLKDSTVIIPRYINADSLYKLAG
jgi:membrane fusion protein, multidrug efflux system